MFLSDISIADYLSRDTLGIDPPPDADQYGSVAIDLRLGNQFLQLPSNDTVDEIDLANPYPLPLSRAPSRLETVLVGETLSVAPAAAWSATTLEFIRMPHNLVGFLFPQSGLERVGLSVSAGMIHPTFQGRLSLTFRNNNTVPITVHPGLRVVRLCLAILDNASARTYALGPDQLSKEINDWKTSLEEFEQKSSVTVPSSPSLAKQLLAVLSAERIGKGRALEELMADMFTRVDGLEILKRNARLKAEELDLVVKNNLTTGFWRIAGSPLIVECKNWSAKVGAREISVLVDKLQSLSPDARVGILVAVNGITGDSYRDAMLKVREARQRGQYILVLERKDLEEIATGAQLSKVIERKYDETLLI